MEQKKFRRPRFGTAAHKILLLLLAGAAFMFVRSPRGYRRIVKSVANEWRRIDQKNFAAAVRRLYESKLVSSRNNADGTTSIVLNRSGEQAALSYKIEDMTILKPESWDRKWRVVLFDIPEKKKRLRDTLRMRLRQLGLIELQKSVFVHPYECRDEIDFVIEFYDARRYVRFIEATHIDTELHLKRRFRLF